VFNHSSGEKGWLPRASQKDNKTIPSSMTTVRTSYRPVDQYQVAISGGVTDGEQFSFGSMCWSESNKHVAAFPGGKLEAKLVHSDGKVRVRLLSEVVGDKEKGYVYKYTVENLTNQPCQFQWAGLKGKLKPKKAFTKEERSASLTEERSGQAILDFDGGEATIHIRANLWAMPK
jgi:hypothetical protein